MNLTERELLTEFLNRLGQTPAGTKDAEAEAMIRQAVAAAPDAPYLLVQRAIILEQSLKAAQDRVSQLEKEIGSLRGGATPSFLGDSNRWGTSATATPRPPQAPPVSPPAVAQYSPQPAAATNPTPTQSGAGSFLTTAAATAAGVVGGSLLFQGLENLFHHGQSPVAGSSFLTPAANHEPTAVNDDFLDDSQNPGADVDAALEDFPGSDDDSSDWV